MKTFGTIMKILAVLAAIAGAIYVFATYGDRIVAWAKRLLDKLNGCCCCQEAVTVPAAETSAQEETVQAEEADFEG